MTGTEAVQAALRIARAATGRQKVLVFQGHYDGWADTVLFNIGTPGRPSADTGAAGELAPMPESPGVETVVASDLVVAQWNDTDAVEPVLARHRDELAAVIMEPIMGNSGVIVAAARLPRNGSRPLHPLRDRPDLRRDHHGVPRGPGRRAGPPRRDAGPRGIREGPCERPARLVRRRAADLFEDVGTGRVMHAGTFNAWAPGMAAAVATLRILGDPASGVYEHIERVGTRLRDGLREVAARHGGGVLVQGLPSVFNDVVQRRCPRHSTTRTSARADWPAFRRFVPMLLSRGVRIAGRGNLMLSAAHIRRGRGPDPPGVRRRPLGVPGERRVRDASMTAVLASGDRRTVSGDIPAADLGRTLIHEHLASNLTTYWAPDLAPEIATATVSLQTLAEVRAHAFSVRDNLVLDDLENGRPRGDRVP